MSERWGTWRSRIRKINSTIKMIFGMPDYDRYLQHWYANHAAPGIFPMTEKEYYLYALHNRYVKGGVNRCC